MPRSKGVNTVVNFSGGKSTEASEINPVPNTAEILDNIDLLINGSVRRRLGLDFESGFTSSFFLDNTTARTSPVPGEGIQHTEMSIHLWDNVRSDARISFLVLRFGNRLFVYNAAATPISGGFIAEIDITSFATSLSASPRTVLSSSDGVGAILFTSDGYDPFFITLDEDGSTFTTTAIDLKIRDFKGVEDNLFVEERPNTLDDNHLYNLLNQGWTTSRINSFAGTTVVDGTGLGGTPVTRTGSADNPTATVSGHPSNADIMFLGMKVNGSGDLIFSGSELIEQTLGNTPASKGHFILSAFEVDRAVQSGVSVGNFLIPDRLVSSTFYQGRAFYSGIESKVHFSQTLTDISKIGKCYQEQDPTAEDFNDLLATDGGVIEIPEAGQIHSLLAIEAGVIALSKNGVWFISGGEANFSATDLQVERISDVGSISGSSIVNVENTIMYWSNSGIIVLNPDQISGKLSAVNITTSSIQEDYVNISENSKQFASGSYNTETKIVMWLFSSKTTFGSIKSNQNFDKALLFNVALNAFYEYTFTESLNITLNPIIIGAFTTRASFVSDVQEVVTANKVDVTENGVDVTVPFETTTIIDNTILKFATLVLEAESGLYFFRFGELISPSFRDWESQGTSFTGDQGADYTSTIETTSENFGTLAVDKQNIYTLPYFKRTETGLNINQPLPDETYAVCIIIDTSGSMGNDNRMDLVRDASKNIIRMYSEHSRLTGNTFGLNIITFGTNVKETFLRRSESDGNDVFSQFWQGDLPAVYDFLDGLEAIGQTNFEDPYGAAQDFFLNLPRFSEKRVCYFLTDGLPNTKNSGSTSAQSAVDAALIAGADMFDQSSGTLTGTKLVDVSVINIVLSDTTFSSQLDNTPTPTPAVPVVTTTGQLVSAMIDGIAGVDLNLQTNELLNPSACQVTGKWEWTNSSDYERWSDPQQGYRLEKDFLNGVIQEDDEAYPKSVINTKLKIRGKGKSLRLRFESEDNKHFHLLGYALPFTATTET